MRKQVILVAAALVLAPLGARGADLVVWWEEGYYAQEDEAVREIIAAFEQQTGKQVDLAFYPQADLHDQIEAALEAGQPPTSPTARVCSSRDGCPKTGSWT